MKKALIVIVGLLLLAGVSSVALAYTVSDTIGVKVTVTGNLSVSITEEEYQFGTLSANFTSVSTSAVTVTNDSDGYTEDYQMKATNTTSWTLAATQGEDTFCLAAQFSTSQPSNADGSWTDDDLTTSDQPCSADTFGNGTAGEAGIDVPANAGTGSDRSLWFRIKTPSTVKTGAGTEQTSTVTVTAQQST